MVGLVGHGCCTSLLYMEDDQFRSGLIILCCWWCMSLLTPRPGQTSSPSMCRSNTTPSAYRTAGHLAMANPPGVSPPISAFIPAAGSNPDALGQGRSLWGRRTARRHKIEMWFNNADQTGCTTWDSRYGQKYWLDIATE
jgi:hypothetical protein